MKYLIIYYSRTGNTKKVASYIAQRMGCDIEEIVDMKVRRGLIGYLIGGKDAATKKLTEIKELQKDLSAYDAVIIGTPVWAFTMTPAIRTYLHNNKEKFRNVAFFCTEIGTGGKKTFTHMEAVCGKKPKSVLEITEKEVKKDTYMQKVQEFIERIIESMQRS